MTVYDCHDWFECVKIAVEEWLNNNSIVSRYYKHHYGQLFVISVYDGNPSRRMLVAGESIMMVLKHEHYNNPQRM